MPKYKAVILNQSHTDEISNEISYYYRLSARQANILLSLTEPLSWPTRWQNLTMSQDDLDVLRADIERALLEHVMIDCEDIEPCIETSTTIVNIQNDISNNTTNISNNTTNINNIGDTVNHLDNDGLTNDYPPLPTINEPDNLCGASWNIALTLNAFLQDMVTASATDTLYDFISDQANKVGLIFANIVSLWDIINALTNPSIGDELLDAVQYVAESFYCCELDEACAIGEIEASGDISEDAKTLYVALINAWTSGAKKLVLQVGALDVTQNCAGFCDDYDWIAEFDFTAGSQSPPITSSIGTYDSTNHYWKEAQSGGTRQVNVNMAFDACDIVRLEVGYQISSPDCTNGAQIQFTGEVAFTTPNVQAWTNPLPFSEDVYQLDVNKVGVTGVGVGVIATTQRLTCPNAHSRIGRFRIYGTGTIPSQLIPYQVA